MRLGGGAEGEGQVLRRGGGQQFGRFGRATAGERLGGGGEGDGGGGGGGLPTGVSEEGQRLGAGSQARGLDNTQVLLQALRPGPGAVEGQGGGLGEGRRGGRAG